MRSVWGVRRKAHLHLRNEHVGSHAAEICVEAAGSGKLSRWSALDADSTKPIPNNIVMPPKAAKQGKGKAAAPSKAAAATKKPSKAVVEQPEEIVASGSEYDSDASDDSDIPEGQDVSEKGLARLMKALGDDGLDEADMAALAAMKGGEGIEDSDEDDEGDDDDEDDDDEDDNDEDDEDDEDIDDSEAEDDEESEEEPAAELDATPKDTLAASLARSGLVPTAEEEEDEDEDEEDEGEDEEEGDESALAVDSLTDEAFAALPDAVRSNRFHREKINNRAALEAVRESIALEPSGSGTKKSERMDWIEHMSLTWDKSVSAELEEQGATAEDDLKRELVFYRQALSAAVIGRGKVLQAGIPFSRPSDFFAEMVKSDTHMERVRQRLLDEKAGIEASEEAKRQRELKKFGKKVQVEKGLQRQKEKKEMEDKIKGLKRKRGGGVDANADNGDDDFDVRLENALGDGAQGSKQRSAPRKAGKGPDGKAKMPRTARDDKYGFGGKKRFSKSNTKDSTEGGFGKFQAPGKKKGGAGGKGGKGKRPGKSKRAGH
ncbi:unnamed protein product [Parajaminaea phylloscopi]